MDGTRRPTLHKNGLVKHWIRHGKMAVKSSSLYLSKLILDTWNLYNTTFAQIDHGRMEVNKGLSLLCSASTEDDVLLTECGLQHRVLLLHQSPPRQHSAPMLPWQCTPGFMWVFPYILILVNFEITKVYLAMFPSSPEKVRGCCSLLCGPED